MVNLGGAPHNSDDIQDLWYALKESGFTDSTGENPLINTTISSTDPSNISRYSSQFNDLSVVNREQFININSSQGLSKVRDVVETQNGGTVTSNSSTGEIELSTGAKTDSFANIETARWGQYNPGYIGEIGIGARLPQQPSGDAEILWGYFNGDDGFYFGYDSTDIFVAVRRNGVEEKRVYRANWNGRDPEDVEGVSFSPADGGIYQINYAWYGYGSIQFTVVSSETDQPQQNIVVHTFSPEQYTSITNPNQPVQMRIDNNTSSNSIDAYLGGRQYSILGEVADNFRLSDETFNQVSIDNGSWTHIGSIRRKLTDDRRVNMLIDGFEANTDSTVDLALVVNANISGTTYGDFELIPPTETIAEVTADGTFDGIGEGTKSFGTQLAVDQNAKSGASEPIRELNEPIPRDYPLSLIAKGVGGTATVDATLRVREQW